MSEKHASLKEAAVAYAEAGVPIFPLRPGRKDPYPRTSGFRDATTDVDLVENYWTVAPTANIGARCGVAFDVLDVDVKVTIDGEAVKDGRPSLHQLNQAGLLAGSIGMSRTRHDGLHLFYPPSGLGVAHIAHLHVDFQARDSYVVMPPSIVAAEEGIAGPGRYEWSTPLDLGQEGAAPFDWAAAKQLLYPAPDGFIAALVAAKSQHRLHNPSVEPLIHWLSRQNEGNRNFALFWAACRAVENGLDPADLKPTALSIGLTEHETTKTIESARNRIQEKTT